MSAPAPTAVKAGWFPASVSLPVDDPDGVPMVWHRCRVYLAPEGAYVYKYQPPADGVTPDWFSPVDYVRTEKPRGSWQDNSGVYIRTTAGLLTVTPGGGCACGSPLKRWVPEFARKSVPW